MRQIKHNEIAENFKDNYTYYIAFLRSKFRNASNEDIEEAISIAFISMIQNPPTLKTACFRTYASRGCINKYLNILKYRKKYTYSRDLPILQEQFLSNIKRIQQHNTKSEDQYTQDRLEEVLEIINNLPAKQKQIALDKCKGLALTEIANKYNANYDTTKASWLIVLNKLKKELTTKGKEEFLWKVNI